MKNMWPTPWKVYTGILRPQFPKSIVEIIDRDGKVVMPWSSFDSASGRLAEQKRLAKTIVDAVNFYHRLEKP